VSTLVLALAVPSASANPASAAPPLRGSSDGDAVPPPLEEEPPALGADLGVVVEVPLMFGAQGTLELPYGFLIQGEAGVLPEFAIDAVDGALRGSGAYDATTSDMVRGSLGNSLVLRLSGGIRPFPEAGFEMLGGYTVVALGGGVDARAAVAAAGGALPSNVPDGEITLSTTVHCFHFSLGWRWILADHFLIRASLGYVQSVGSSTSVHVPSSWSSDPTVATAVAVASPVIDAKLDDVLTTYVKLPVLGLSLGYRF
jgi:hypothetical protein